MEAVVDRYMHVLLAVMAAAPVDMLAHKIP